MMNVISRRQPTPASVVAPSVLYSSLAHRTVSPVPVVHDAAYRCEVAAARELLTRMLEYENELRNPDGVNKHRRGYLNQCKGLLWEILVNYKMITPVLPGVGLDGMHDVKMELHRGLKKRMKITQFELCSGERVSESDQHCIPVASRVLWTYMRRRCANRAGELRFVDPRVVPPARLGENSKSRLLRWAASDENTVCKSFSELRDEHELMGERMNADADIGDVHTYVIPLASNQPCLDSISLVSSSGDKGGLRVYVNQAKIKSRQGSKSRFPRHEATATLISSVIGTDNGPDKLNVSLNLVHPQYAEDPLRLLWDCAILFGKKSYLRAFSR